MTIENMQGLLGVLCKCVNEISFELTQDCDAQDIVAHGATLCSVTEKILACLQVQMEYERSMQRIRSIPFLDSNWGPD